MDLLSSPFLTFFCQISLSTRCNKEFHLQRRSLSIQPLHTPTPTPYLPHMQPPSIPFNFAGCRPTVTAS